MRVVPSPAWAAADAEVVVVAVKPADAVDALESCAEALPEGALVLSIAAGVTIAALEAAAPGRPVVRAMPNTGALVGRGAAAIAAGTHATELDLEVCERILGSVGIVVRVPEAQLDAVTGLSGSGPAYVFLVAEAMIEAGVLVGLPRDTSEQLVRQTLLGAATLLDDGDATPESLRAAVTSPGGTTAAGLAVLEAHGVRAAFLDAVEAATRRSERAGTGRESQAALVAPAAEAARSTRASAPSSAEAGPNLRELLKQQHVAGRSTRFGRDEIVGIDAPRRARRAATRCSGCPPFAGLITGDAGRGRGRARLRLGGRRPRARIAPARTVDGFTAACERVLEVAARRWAARVRDRAPGVAPAALPSARRRAPRPRAPTVLARRRDRRVRARRADACAGSTRSRCSPTAPRSSATTASTPPRSGSSRSPVPTSSSPTARYAGVAVAVGLEVVAFADLDAVALAVAAWQGRALRIVPLDDRRPPRGLRRAARSARSASPPPRVDPFAVRSGAGAEPARSCSFATRAAGAYAHPAEKRGKRKG